MTGPRTGLRVVMIIQARMGSTRLPGKSMMDLAGAPLIARLIERAKRCSGADSIVLATTEKAEDDLFERVAGDCGVHVFRGSEDDLVDRYHEAAVVHEADVIVRVPGDNPVPEPGEIDRLVSYHVESGNDFSSSYPDFFENGYPDGIGAEAFTLRALGRVRQMATDARNREHPHTTFYEHPEVFKIGTIECPEEFRRPDLVLDVNTLEQYRFMAELYAYLYPRNPEFHITDVIRWYDGVYRVSKDPAVTA